jgi:hypothetical protein
MMLGDYTSPFTGDRGADNPLVFAGFIRGGDPSSGGVLHAVTTTAQTLADADDASEVERHAITAMRLAADHAN